MPRWRLTAVALSLALALLTLAGCNKLKARDQLNKGVRAYKAAQFDTAIEHFQRAIKLDPQLINARVYLAVAYASQFIPGSPAEENKRLGKTAIQAFEEVLEVDPTNVDSTAWIAGLYFGLEEFDKAKEYRRRLIELDSDNPEHPYMVAVINWTLTYPVRQELRNRLRLTDPVQPLPRRQREALAIQNSALVEEGIEMLQKALEIKPDYADAMVYLNLLYREKADLVADGDEREQLLQQADELAERAQQLKQQPATPAAAR
ncbi:MAG: tetratricopeptide repeat protein [Terriglobia bacterium]